MRRMLFLTVVALTGCAMKVNGFVTDATTGRPVPGARVRIEERFAYANDGGAYVLKVYRASRVNAEVSAPGYETAVFPCEAPSDHPVCDFTLTPHRE
jgi:hypothetical protein